MRYTVDTGSAGKRLDAYLGEITDLSRSAAAKLIESGAVTVGGKKVEKKYQVKEVETDIICDRCGRRMVTSYTDR